MKVLITVITGFVDFHLVEYLSAKDNVEIYGALGRRSDTENIERIKDKLIPYKI